MELVDSKGRNATSCTHTVADSTQAQYTCCNLCRDCCSAYTTQSPLTYLSIYTEMYQDFLLLFQQNNVVFGYQIKT